MGKERLANLSLLHIHYEQKLMWQSCEHFCLSVSRVGVINCACIIISVLICFDTLFSNP